MNFISIFLYLRKRLCNKYGRFFLKLQPYDERLLYPESHLSVFWDDRVDPCRSSMFMQ